MWSFFNNFVGVPPFSTVMLLSRYFECLRYLFLYHLFETPYPYIHKICVTYNLKNLEDLLSI